MESTTIRKTNILVHGTADYFAYTAGTMAYIQKYFDTSANPISALSGGVIGAIALASELPMDTFMEYVIYGSFDQIKNQWTAWGMFDKMKENFQKLICDTDCGDTMQKVNGRLHIQMFDILSQRNQVFSQFESAQDMIDAGCASCFLPLVHCQLWDYYRGRPVMDSGSPVSIFKLASEIWRRFFDCTRKGAYAPLHVPNEQEKTFHIHPNRWRNVYEYMKPAWNHFGFTVEEMKKLYQRGYDDAFDHHADIRTYLKERR